MVEKFCKCGKISRFLICNFFEYLFGILSEILMCEIILLELLGNVGVCGIYWHHGCMKKKNL